MKIIRIVSIFTILSFIFVFPLLSADKSISDEEVSRLIIKESISAYPGNCPCPYNRASNGSRCGKRSAYSRAGGYSPLCYSNDITDGMVKDYRERHGL